MSKTRSPRHTSQIKPLANAIAACLALSAMPSQAANFNVSSNADLGAGSLRAAITLANAAAGADTITFDAGLGVIALTSGQIDINEELTINAAALGTANPVTISGGGGNTNLKRVFGMTVNEPLTLNNLIITNGLTTGNSSNTGDCASATTTFTDGGAVCAVGDLELIDTTISNSSTAGNSARGGGFRSRTNGTVTLTNSTVSGNSTTGYGAYGGGFNVSGDTTLTNSTILNNRTAGTSANGGGFVSRKTTLTNSTVSGNRTTGDRSRGGGFNVGGFAILTNSMVSGNSTTKLQSRGGGFFAGNSATLSNSTVSGNSTAGDRAYGGGFSTNSTATLSNSTVSGNSTAGALAAGGGFRAFNATLTNSTITQNSANHATASGDGFYLSDNGGVGSTLNSSIVTDNGTDNIAVGFNAPFNASFSLLGTEVAAELQAANATNVFNNAPGLSALADNGCSTPAGAVATAACVQTHALLAASPALDKGQANGLGTDQRGNGFLRSNNNLTDIGAFQLVGSPPANTQTPKKIPTLNIWLLGLLSLMLGFVGRVTGPSYGGHDT